MSVLDWSVEKRLLVELRKAVQSARRAGESTTGVRLSPNAVLGMVEAGDKVVGEVTNRFGRRFQFRAEAVFIESGERWARVPYDSIVSYHWIAETENIAEKVPLKQEYGDRIILVDRQGARYDLDGLGRAFQGMHRFFMWLMARNSKPSNKPLQPTSGGQAGVE